MLCLPKEASRKMLEKLKDGTIDPGKLAAMASAERRAFFSDIVGEKNAPHVNSQFEAKLLLKNQQQGMIRWAKSLTGITPEAKRDILSRVNRMADILQPKEMENFMEDLAARRLGISVTEEEASRIVDLARGIEDSRGTGDRLDYGKAKVRFNSYVQELKDSAAKKSLKEHAVFAVTSPISTLSKIGGLAKSLKASLDDSAIFRQGWKTMFTDPKTWASNAAKSFSDIAGSLKGREVIDEVKADILSRPTYERMQKAKLAIGSIEETFPTGLPEKVPLFGRIYKASEQAYTGFMYRMRADVFDKYLSIAERAGVDVTDRDVLLGIGKLVNSLTGRGDLGKFEGAAEAVNNIFFSPRFVKSQIDFLTAHSFDSGMGGFARKQALKNLAKVVAGTATILAIANAIAPGSVEADPTSSDFGKIRVGSTRFDVSGGMASVLTLAARLALGETKSASTGETVPLNSDRFGSKTKMDVIFDYLQGKTSPIASVFKDYLKGKTFDGKTPTAGGELNSLFTPLPITTFTDLKDNPDSAPMLATMLADGLGLASNTYSSPEKRTVSDTLFGGEATTDADRKTLSEIEDVSASLGKDVKFTDFVAGDGKKLSQFLDSVGPEKYREASAYYSETLKGLVEKEISSGAYGKMTTDEKFAELSKLDDDAVDSTFSKYGFSYEAEKPSTQKEKVEDQKTVIDLVSDYAKAYKTDPANAFEAMFTDEKLDSVEGNLVKLQRFKGIDFEAEGGSEQYTKSLLEKAGIPYSQRKEYNLEHIVPVTTGGDNSPGNLYLEKRSVHNSYTPVEVLAGKLVKKGVIRREYVADVMRKLKVDHSITVDEARKAFEKYE